MKVKIKSEKEIKRMSSYSGGMYIPRGHILHFNPEMFSYCGKTLILEKHSIWKKVQLFAIKNESDHLGFGWRWSKWMFDIEPEVDSKKNFLLEF